MVVILLIFSLFVTIIPFVTATKDIQLTPTNLITEHVENLSLAEQLLLNAKQQLDADGNTFVVVGNSTNSTNSTVNSSIEYGYMDYVKSDFGMYYEVGAKKGKDIGLTDPVSNTPIPLAGDVYVQTDQTSNMTNYYVLLGDTPDSLARVKKQFSSIKQDPIVFGVPVTLRQSLKVTNQENFSSNYTINLGDYPDDVPAEYLKESSSVAIFLNGELISEVPFFEISLNASQTKSVVIVYTFSPITKELHCEEQSIKDILPSDATIIQSDLSLSTIVAKKCSIRLNYENMVKDVSIGLSLNGIDHGQLESVYSVQDGAYLPIEDNAVRITFD